MQILPLTGSHDRQAFDCGAPVLNDWLRQVARQHQDKGLSRTYVATLEQSPAQICGYYALTLSEIDARSLLLPLRKKLPRRIPGVRLGRLAVDRQYQRKRLGELLLVDTLTRAELVYRQAGGIGLFVDAMDQEAAGFYLRFGFAPAPDQPLLLFLPATVSQTSPPRGSTRRTRP